ncbi:uncharacterized protein LOC133844887 isoform X1 [Drosophila sulfurigaster albostrigata]|uniref:uncharacterized protein LOC133844887 isoform X1 n=1 Tax=Drosophila sulfurigaster albostrigata TaxID=89887 RepID=UPI002D2197DE|nr:uncharacterized protein LOC133844887 isoform X1 [Drosophila sulfurigaster albostrigata]
MSSVGIFFWCCCILATINFGHNSLNPVDKSDCEFDNVIHIISKFHHLMHFNNFVLFVGHSHEAKGSAIATSLHRRVMHTFDRPVIVAGCDTGPLNHIITTYSLALVLFTGIQDPILNVVINALGKNSISTIPILFVYKSSDGLPLTTNGRAEFFHWCLKYDFRNTIMAFENKTHDLELWTYEMYDGMLIHRVTQISSSLRRNHQSLINQRQLKVAVYQNLPFAFVLNSGDYRDLTGSGNVSLGGETGILLAEFVHFIGGTLQIIPQSRDEYFTNLTVCGSMIDFGANMLPSTKVSTGVSPLVIATKYCLVVPFERQVPLSKFFTVFFRIPTLNVFSIILLIAMTLIRRLINPHKPIADLIYMSFQVHWGQAIPSRTINRMGIAEKILTICGLIYNLYITTIFSCILATTLTTGNHMPEIIDIESFVANDISIMISESQMKELSQVDNIPVELSRRMFIAPEETLERHLNSLNDSYVYLMETHRFAQMKFMQQRLRRPKLKMAPEPLCTLDLYLRLPIQQELGFLLVLTRFVEDATESGLRVKWMQMGLEQLKQANMIRQAPYDPPLLRGLSLSFFTFGFQIYAAGIILSLIVLLIEFIYDYWLKRSNNYNNVIIV